MSRLLLAELRRIASRRLVRVTVALALLGIVLGGAAAFAFSAALPEETYQQRVAEAKARQDEQDATIEACLQEHDVRRGEITDEIAALCFPDEPVPGADDPRFHRRRLEGIVHGVTGALAVVGWAVGASLAGAEFASRSMTTLLTWETRRGRVFLAKSATTVVATALLALGALALVVLAMLPALTVHGAPLQPNDPSWASLAGAVGRGVVLTGLSAAMGFAIATIGRNTAAALGAGFAYIIVLENILGSSFERWRRWLLLGNVIVFVSGDDNGSDIPGRTVIGAGVLLAVVAVVLLLAAGGTFRSRDVA